MPERDPDLNPHRKAILALHKLGRQVLREDARAGETLKGRHRGSVERVAVATGRPKSQLHVARRFAEQFPAGEKLDWFCSLGTDGGTPLTASHAMRLALAGDRRQREQLARRSARYGWSVVRLTQEIQLLNKTARGHGGRRPAQPADTKDALLQLRGMATRWIRWSDHFTELSGDQSVARQLPRHVRAKMQAATAAMVQLNYALSKALRR